MFFKKVVFIFEMAAAVSKIVREIGFEASKIEFFSAVNRDKNYCFAVSNATCNTVVLALARFLTFCYLIQVEKT